MAKAEIILGEGGGIPKGELLWSDTFTTVAARNDIPLSKSITNYDYLKLKVKLNSNTDKFIELIFSASDFKNNSSFSANALNPSVYSYFNSSTTISRQFAYVNDTTFGWGQAYKSGATADNSWLLPIELRGIKL